MARFQGIPVFVQGLKKMSVDEVIPSQQLQVADQSVDQPDSKRTPFHPVDETEGIMEIGEQWG